MRDAWRKMQVPIIGLLGILMIFVLIIWKLGVTTDEYAVRGYTDYVPTPVISGEKCANTYDPICCNDGVTYDNLCLCKAAGATPEYQGICR